MCIDIDKIKCVDMVDFEKENFELVPHSLNWFNQVHHDQICMGSFISMHVHVTNRFFYPQIQISTPILSDC